MRKIRDLMMLFIMLAVSGWLYEVIYTAIVWQEFENRGVLFGPWLPLYGFGGLLILLCLRRSLDRPVRLGMLNVRPLVTFVYVTVAATLVELAASYVLDACGLGFTNLWDYSERALHFEGRISLSASLLFGLIGVIIAYLVLPLYRRLIALRRQRAVSVMAWIVIALFLADVLARIPLGSNYMA